MGGGGLVQSSLCVMGFQKEIPQHSSVLRSVDRADRDSDMKVTSQLDLLLSDEEAYMSDI